MRRSAGNDVPFCSVDRSFIRSIAAGRAADGDRTVVRTEAGDIRMRNRSRNGSRRRSDGFGEGNRRAVVVRQGQVIGSAGRQACDILIRRICVAARSGPTVREGRRSVCDIDINRAVAAAETADPLLRVQRDDRERTGAGTARRLEAGRHAVTIRTGYQPGAVGNRTRKLGYNGVTIFRTPPVTGSGDRYGGVVHHAGYYIFKAVFRKRSNTRSGSRLVAETNGSRIIRTARTGTVDAIVTERNCRRRAGTFRSKGNRFDTAEDELLGCVGANHAGFEAGAIVRSHRHHILRPGNCRSAFVLVVVVQTDQVRRNRITLDRTRGRVAVGHILDTNIRIHKLVILNRTRG